MLTHLIPAVFVQRHKQFKSVEILRKLSTWNMATHTRKPLHTRGSLIVGFIFFWKFNRVVFLYRADPNYLFSELRFTTVASKAVAHFLHWASHTNLQISKLICGVIPLLPILQEGVSSSLQAQAMI